MADLIFSDPRLAGFYDAMCWGRDDFDFYRPMIMEAASVLDVGCGTGAMLHQAREAGHAGRLCGLDPAPGMLAQARKRTDIEWIEGELTSVAWSGDFDLVVMTGHAFQVLVEDEDLWAALASVRAALNDHGRFAFETRNPLARAWETWDSQEPSTVTNSDGATVRVSRRLTAPFDGRVVSFSHTFESDAWTAPRVSHSTLRFLGRTALGAALEAAGLAIEYQFGGWDRSPVTASSPEIITIARKAP
ncbi:MAG TPA: class I SAM-dependent methyltransferase [Caulobacteraceae bacterium]